MTRSTLVRVGGAFLAGLLVALIAAATYSRLSSRAQTAPVVQIAADSHRDIPVDPPAAADPVPAPKPVQQLPKADRELPRLLPRVKEKTQPEPAAPASAAPLPENPYQASSDPTPAPAPSPRATAVNEEQAPSASVEPSPAPAPPKPHTVTIPAGTSIVVRVTETLSSDRNTPGDAFRGTLQLPIVSEGFVIAERGSSVSGRVVNADRGGRVKGTPSLSVELTSINTTDGQHVAIQTASVDRNGPTGKGRDAAKVGGAAALGALIGAIAGGGKGAGIGAGVGGAAGAGDVLLTHGKAAAINSESELTFRLAEPLTLTEKLR